MAEPRGHDVVVIGASAGGVEPLCRIASELPRDLPAAVLAVLHIAAGSPSALPVILNRYGRLPASHPRVEGEPLEHGRMYVAPPDRHMLVEPDRVVLSTGPRENRVRPAVDVLFRSAAAAHGPRVIGVVLSGALDDGSAGLVAIKRQGGLAVVQDPDEAEAAGMPRAALQVIEPDRIVRIGEAASVIERMVRTEVTARPGKMDATTLAEVQTAASGDPGAGELSIAPGVPTALSCPDCGAGLFELSDGKLHRFRCYMGHAYATIE